MAATAAPQNQKEAVACVYDDGSVQGSDTAAAACIRNRFGGGKAANLGAKQLRQQAAQQPRGKVHHMYQQLATGSQRLQEQQKQQHHDMESQPGIANEPLKSLEQQQLPDVVQPHGDAAAQRQRRSGRRQEAGGAKTLAAAEARLASSQARLAEAVQAAFDMRPLSVHR